MEIGTQRLTGSVPYLSRASLNDWDILYTKNEFRTFEYNDWNHEFVFEFENLDTTPLAVRDGSVIKSAQVITVTREVPIDYISILKEEPYDRLSCGIEDYQMDYQDLNPAPIRIRAAKTGSDTKAGTSTGTGAGTNTESGTGSRSAVPSTGDPSDAPSRLGLIAGAAGAGLLAYSKRRTKLEDDGKES